MELPLEGNRWTNLGTGLRVVHVRRRAGINYGLSVEEVLSFRDTLRESLNLERSVEEEERAEIEAAPEIRVHYPCQAGIS